MRAIEVFLVFLRLGLTSFGGPIAHLGYFREEFVARRAWLTDADYSELVALCQFLPGPASSQVGFAIGKRRAGLLGALMAFAGFTAPSAIAMIAAAYGFAALDPARAAPWIQGLKLAAVAVVAQALAGMAKTLTPDAPRQAFALACAAALLLLPLPLLQVGVVALGLAIGPLLVAKSAAAPAQSAPERGGRALAAVSALAFVAGLIGLGYWAEAAPTGAGAAAAPMYAAGALVFGGGHVVLPMLQAGMATPGYVSQDEFLAGYAAAQAMPGPLFSFAGYLGAASDVGPGGWLGGLVGTIAIFAPGFLILLAALPFWNALSASPWAKRSVAGANAAVVGVLGAAFVSPITLGVVNTPADAGVGVACYGLLATLRAPPILVVAVGALAGGLANGGAADIISAWP